MNVGLGIRTRGLVSGYNFSDYIKEREVTSMRGERATVRMSPEMPDPTANIGAELSLEHDYWQVTYGVGLNVPQESRIAGYRYRYDSVATPTDQYEGSEVAYLKMGIGLSSSLTVSRRIFISESPSASDNQLYINAGLEYQSIAFTQGTETWGKDGYEKVIANEHLLGGSLGVSYVIPYGKKKVILNADVRHLRSSNGSDNVNVTQATASVACQYKVLALNAIKIPRWFPVLGLIHREDKN